MSDDYPTPTLEPQFEIFASCPLVFFVGGRMELLSPPPRVAKSTLSALMHVTIQAREIVY